MMPIVYYTRFQGCLSQASLICIKTMETLKPSAAILSVIMMMMTKLLAITVIMTFSGVSGIPCLVVCKKDGTLVTKDGRAGVTSMVRHQDDGNMILKREDCD